jgi:D-alanyl-D-alanine carboxypeptidase/D-alanyl-D-alanine-endopeptidase (penicillin-binding protein 4)
MIKVSQNLHAEMLLREVDAAGAGPGTVEGGLREMRAWLAEVGIPAAEFVAEDGSGLARNNETTPRAITRLLVAMARGPQAEVWRSLFPVGGQDGTLSSRLCCASEGGLIRAKTGTLARAVALSGYADSRANGRLAFAIVVNNFAAPAAQVRAWVDSLATALLE